LARFFIPSERIRGEKLRLAASELDHMKALRVSAGDVVHLFDERGREHEAIVRVFSRREAEVEILRSYAGAGESGLEIKLAQAVGKGEKMDWVVEKAVELGARAFLPFVCAHTVPRLDAEKSAQRLRRWERIALSAAEQSGRSRLMAVEPLASFEEVLEEAPAHDLRLFCWEGERSMGLGEVKRACPRASRVLLAIGPEGGFSRDEAERARAAGFCTVHLGPRVLRTETAAVAALALVQWLWGDLESPRRRSERTE
jgi:16S rRNA (uracil1498-N3)-methyltransferase